MEPSRDSNGEARRVLSFTATGVVIPHTLEDVQQALARAGHEVWVQDIAALPRPQEMPIAITDALVRIRPDAVFTVDHVGLLPHVLAALNRPPQVVSWCYDAPQKFLNREFLAMNARYHVFSWDRAYLPWLRQTGFAHVHYQSFGTNPVIFHPVDTPYRHDLSFVGGASEARIRLLRAVAEAGFRVDVFGDEAWRGVHPNLAYHGPAANRTDCPRIYSASRINLNLTSEQLLTALPVRVFDVLACGGFLLTDERPDTRVLFEPGRHLAVYRDLPDLLGQIRHYLADDAGRDLIRLAGMQHTLAHHTFDAMVPKMLDTALTGPADAALNQPPSPTRGLMADWLTGAAYLKNNELEPALPRLLAALERQPGLPAGMAALGIWAHQSGRPDSLRQCLAALDECGGAKELAGRLRACDREQRPFDAWNDLYRLAYPSVQLGPGGLVDGWEPGRLHPAPA